MLVDDCRDARERVGSDGQVIAREREEMDLQARRIELRPALREDADDAGCNGERAVTKERVAEAGAGFRRPVPNMIVDRQRTSDLDLRLAIDVVLQILPDSGEVDLHLKFFAKPTGMCNQMLLFGGPASSSNTRQAGFSVRRAATTAPADSAPMRMKSQTSDMLVSSFPTRSD